MCPITLHDARTHSVGFVWTGCIWVKCPVKRDDVFGLLGPRGHALVIASCTFHGTSLENLMVKGFCSKGACIQPRGSDLPNVYTTTWVYESRATKFCTVEPDVCGSSVWNLLHVTLQAPRIFRWFFDLLENCGTLY